MSKRRLAADSLNNKQDDSLLGGYLLLYKQAENSCNHNFVALSSDALCETNSEVMFMLLATKLSYVFGLAGASLDAILIVLVYSIRPLPAFLGMDKLARDRCQEA